MPLGSSFADVVPAPPSRVSPDLRLSLAVYAAAWPLAIVATRADSRVSDSTAASSAAPGISARSLCVGTCAIPAVCLWSRHRLALYARYVPWEVSLPLGPPGEDRYSSSGTYPFAVCSDGIPPAQSPALRLAASLRLCLAKAAAETRKETKEGGHKNLPTAQHEIKRDRRRQGRRRSR